jgi:hypothetical protein
MDLPPKVICEKPALPTLWLDTSVIIKLTKIARSEALQRVEVERLTRLRALIEELTSAEKLLCPQADQEEEYVAQRLDKEVHGDFLVLSLGIRLRHRQGVFDYQVQVAMKAYVQKAQEINLPADMFFHGDPADQLQRARERSFVIGTNPFRDDELIARPSSSEVGSTEAVGRIAPRVRSSEENLRAAIAERRTRLRRCPHTEGSRI